MTYPAPPPTLPITPRKSVVLRPTFLEALRGVWLFTWKSQLTLRRLPPLLLGLLALPGLVFLTTSSPRAWSQRHALLGDPLADVNELGRRLSRSGLRPLPEQNDQLSRIFTEEYARTEREAGDMARRETSPDQEGAPIRACYERIHDRVQGVLDERQFNQFQSFEKRKVLQGQRGSQPVWNRTSPFYHWLIDFYFFVILPMTCVGACGSLIREESQADTLGFLITRPLTRARLLIVKYLCQTTWLQIVVLIEALLLFAAGGLRHIPALGGLMLLFLTTQFLAVLAWSALGSFMGLVTKRYMAVALVYGFIMEMGIGRIPTNINTLSLMRNLKTLLSHDAALQAVYDWPAKSLPVSLSALLVATALFVSLAAFLFTFNEYHHTAETQK